MGHEFEPQLGHLTFMEIDHEIISTATDSRRAVVSYWWKYVHKYWFREEQRE